MGIENPLHLLFIAAVALVVLGPKRLPELARAAGKSMREFREALNGGVVEEDPAGGQVVELPAAPIDGQAAQRPSVPVDGQSTRRPADPISGHVARQVVEPAVGQTVQEEDPAQRVRSPGAPDRGPL
jgi:sec-independent protein translocase protein TatA